MLFLLLRLFQLWPLGAFLHWLLCPFNMPSSFLFFPFFFLIFIYLFIYLWLCWVFVSVRGLSPVVANGGHSSLWCAGLSPSRPLLLWSTGSRREGPVILAHGPSCSAACGIFPDQGSNPCPLHWQADSQPLCHQGSPSFLFFEHVLNLLVPQDAPGSSCIFLLKPWNQPLLQGALIAFIGEWYLETQIWPLIVLIATVGLLALMTRVKEIYVDIHLT